MTNYSPYYCSYSPFKIKTMKSILLIFSAALSFQSMGQTIPILSETDLIHKEDLKKKPGWIKVKLDSHFKETDEDSLARFEYYDFCNVYGVYNSTYSKRTGLFSDKPKTVYHRDDEKS